VPHAPRLNGRPLADYTFRHTDLAGNNELSVEMGQE
jgi:hypothetical protein